MRRLLAVLTLAVAAAACSGSDSAPETTTADPSPTETTAPDTAPTDTAATTTPARSYAGTDPAPEFPDGLDWLNTAEPLSFATLRGKVVLLDFWTYGCINCIHIIPDLKRLEEEYPTELVVIGVHSAKFENEADTDNIRQIILRYGLEHPVVNDRDFQIWQTWGANAWPTVVLIDPAGNVVGGHSGEGVYDVVEPVVASLVAEFAERGQLDTTRLNLALERTGRPDTVLSFPGKVLVDPTSGILYVADTNHHRIVAVDPDSGDVIDAFGSGRPGATDGSARTARFSSPQGMALSDDGAVLFVADTGNHLIRSIALTTGEVSTVAGTGRQAWPPAAGPATETGFNSPWDLALGPDGRIYVAMAGSHQLWVYDPAAGVVAPIVGSAREGTTNGPLADAELAQPSGLAFGTGGRLYFADSESSSIRVADLDTRTTAVVAGSDRNLFEFGDVDGTGTEARLQHPLGVAHHSPSGLLYVADTYNSKIKRIDPATGETTTYLGAEHGWRDGTDPRFYEPGGLAILGDVLFVADTNNHVVRRIDLATGETGTIVLRGIERFNPPPDDPDYAGTTVQLDPVSLPSGSGSVRLDLTLPAGYKVNDDAPSSVTWSVSGGFTDLAGTDTSLTGARLPVEYPAEFVPGDGSLTADVTLVYCAEEAAALCLIEQIRFVAPVTVEETAGRPVLSLPYAITLPAGA